METTDATFRAMQQEESYWLGVKARVLPALAVALAAAAGAWLADDDIGTVALLVVVVITFAAAVLLPPRLSRRSHRQPDA